MCETGASPRQMIHLPLRAASTRLRLLLPPKTAVGFVVRPLGALIFGSIGDIYGRQTTLRIAIVCMAVSARGREGRGRPMRGAGKRWLRTRAGCRLAGIPPPPPPTHPPTPLLTCLAHLCPAQIPTVIIGCLPTYSVGPYTAGIAAPILLTIMRLFQGLAMGGEFGPAIMCARLGMWGLGSSTRKRNPRLGGRATGPHVLCLTPPAAV